MRHVTTPAPERAIRELSPLHTPPNRRDLIHWMTAGALATGLPAAWAQTAPAPALLGKLRIVIPANEGGGWDQTSRALGAAMVEANQKSSNEIIMSDAKEQHGSRRYAAVRG